MASGRSRGRWAVAAALALALVGSARAGSEEAAKAKAGKEATREARQILRDLMELGAAVRAEDKAGKAANARGDDVLQRMNRPARTVAKSSLEPAEIDDLLDKSLAEAKTTPARLTTDEEFVRRAYLDLTGKLPTPEQVMTFVKSREKRKRSALIDHLLSTRDYAENWAKYWREVVQFHVTAPNPRLVHLETLQSWLADRLAENTPWDEVARQMITGEGDTAQDGVAVFTAAQGAQPVELAGEVSRVFLGVQIQCAQCHDHPSDQWKREQFHQFAAFFAGVRANRGGKQQPPSFKVAARNGVPRYTMPDKADPAKQIPVDPKFFLASSEASVPKNLTAPQRRELAASYVTGQDNPWFARAFINRVWYVLVGDAFYMPVDDLGPTREAKASEVLDKLAEEFTKSGYDVRWLFRMILNTKAYQRESRSSRSTASRTPFAANCASRLRADQIVSALEGALDIDFRSLMARRNAGGAATKKAQAKAGGALGRQFGPEQALLLLFGVDPSTPNDDVLGTIPQALFLMNNPGLNRAMSAAPGTMLGKLLTSTPDDRAALEFLYLKVLGRRPNGEEVRTCDHYYLKVGNRREAFEDILWALINSTEFLSRR